MELGKRNISFILLLFFCYLSFGQIMEKAKVDSIFYNWDSLEVPGGAIGIIKDNALIYAKGYGIADLEHDIVITPSSVFYIGSGFQTVCCFLRLIIGGAG